MKRYIKYIFLSLLTCLMASSCLDEIAAPQPETGSELTTLVPRVKSFTNQYVTKAYGSREDDIFNLSVLVFGIDGKLIHLQESNGASLTLNKSMLNGITSAANLESATIVMFANISLSDIVDSDGESIEDNKATLTLDNLADYTCSLSNPVITAIPDGFGFPMMGKRESVNLSSTNTRQSAIDVSLKILYAKVNFEIGVAEGTENNMLNENYGTFSLTGYSVSNVSTGTPLEILADGASTPIAGGYTSAAVNGTATGNVNRSSTEPLKFTFYMAESRYNHNLANLSGIYPSDEWLTSTENDDVKNYTSLTDEQKALPQNKLNGVKYVYDDLIQQYKPKLANVDGATPGKGLAAYVTVKGTYTDYRGTTWTVNYKIYLGKDNAHDFHVDRNSEYTNILTIKGVRNNDDHTGSDVWIDHRVDVLTTDLSGNVTITRETLIDSHIEVRPLRVNLDLSKCSGVRLYLPNVNWIGAERFTGKNCQDGSVYCYAGGESTGKRKYFTTSLINELKSAVGDGGYLTLLNNECAWIYFDENPAASDRTAEIRIEFLNAEGGSVGSETYTIVQRGLQTVGTLAVESYEEYLHSYDSADKYNLSTTPVDYTQQGFAWGLSGKKISKDVVVSAAPLYSVEVFGQGINMQDVVSQRYDFLHSSDQPSGNTYYPYVKNGNTWDQVSFETGLMFTDRASANEKLTIMDMGTVPSSAYQYCLSKNKFKEDADGNHTMDIHWYLPDVNELRTLLAANSSTADISSEAYYWSSQPAYKGFGLDQLSELADLLALAGINLGNVDVKDEVSTSARAVSKNGVSDMVRNASHRIRCLYSAAGIKNVDMSERAPDGMGGIFTFWMKGWTDGGKNTAGFFNYMLPSPSTPSGDTQTSDIPNVTIPTKDNSQSANARFPYIVTQGKNGQIEGFQINPGDKNNWDEYSLNRGHYYALADYPGLSDYTLNRAIAVNAYEETSTRKSITETSEKTSKVEKTQSLPSTFTLNPLNDKLTISFDQCDGNTVPVFTYDELYSKVKTTSTQYWNKPVYTKYTYERNPQTTTESDTGSGSSELDYVTWPTNTLNTSKQAIFSSALREAQQEALDNLEDKIKNDPNYQGWTYDANSVTYSPNPSSLSWNTNSSAIKYETREEGSIIKRKIVKCTITLTATLTLSKSSQIELYSQTSGGEWSAATTTTESSGPTVNTDQLRVYSGNSLTISVNGANANDYIISKVKVYISGGNFIKNVPISSDLTTDNYYARFVDSALIPAARGQIAYAEQGTFDYGTGEYIVLHGMEYSGDSDDSSIWQQWTGYDSSVTLVLADYKISTRANFNARYLYQTAATDRSKYVVIDRIEVKCTKKATAATEQ